MISERISNDVPAQMKILNMDPHSNAILQFCLKFEHCKPHNSTYHPRKCDIINDVKLFPTVFRRIYCSKFLTLSNQTSRYKSNCIRIIFCMDVTTF